MKKRLADFALATLALAFASCSVAPVAQTFKAPSLAPAQQAVARAEQHVSGAKGAALKLSDQCAKKNAGWQSAYDQLTAQLTDAYLAAQDADKELEAKQVEIESQTIQANKVIAGVGHDRDVQKLKADAEYHKKMFWMKAFFYAAGAALVLAAWTFRKLWMPFLAGFGV